MMLFIQN